VPDVIRGFDGPNLISVSPRRDVPGFEPGRTWLRKTIEVAELTDALTRRWTSDAYALPQVTVGARAGERFVRVNKGGLATCGRELAISVLFTDLDTEDHGPWASAADLRAAHELLRTHPLLGDAGYYATDKGLRIVQPLSMLLPVEEYERYYARWIADLLAAGLRVDTRCGDWNHIFRLPFVERTDVKLAPEVAAGKFFDIERMRPIELPEPPKLVPIVHAAGDPPPTTPSSPRVVATVEWRDEVPAAYVHLVAPVADAVRQVATEWHTLFLALAGALVSYRIPPEFVPAICRAISLATGADNRSTDRELAARTTVQRRSLGLPATGAARLRASWPAVANALDGALARGALAEARRVAAAEKPATGAQPAATVAGAIIGALRVVPDGLTVLSASCGSGKSYAALRYAIERAKTPYKSAKATGARAADFSKTSISVDKNSLGIQFFRALQAEGIAAKRYFGPASLRHDDGTPVCAYHAAAVALAAGGQSVQLLLCDGGGEPDGRCLHFDDCPARLGLEGDPNARIAIGPHPLLPALDGAAGSTGLLVIDEPPPPIESPRFTEAELLQATESLRYFEGDYAACLEPVLRALRAWVLSGAPSAQVPLAEAIRAGADSIDPGLLEAARRWSKLPDGDVIACAAAAPLSQRGRAPPIRWVYVAMLRQRVGLATQLSAASRVLRTLHEALQPAEPDEPALLREVAARIDERDGSRALVLTRYNLALARALRRQGSVVVTDASADVFAPAYASIVGYERPVLRFEAEDGAPIDRAQIVATHANRRHWQPEGKLVLAPSLQLAVRDALAWARRDEQARRLAVIATPLVELALKGAWNPGDASVDAAWKGADQDPTVLAAARAALGPLLRAWPGELFFGHYGGLRGLNDMADCDAIVTLGDPWMNKGEVQHQAHFLGLGDVWERWYTDRCRAELEQAHGRLRAPHRTRPGRALHVGRILPGGAGWAHASVLSPVGGRPNAPRTVDLAEIESILEKLGGPRAAGRRLGIDHSTLAKYRLGTRPVPARVVEALREAITQPTEGGNPSRSSMACAATAELGAATHQTIDQ
jgi:hypothetical protein